VIRTEATSRFWLDLEGYSHRAVDWSLDGFSMQWYRVGSLREGDTFVIRGLAYGDLDSAQVFLRADVIQIGHGWLAARFLDLNVLGRRLFNDFIERWEIFELSADVA
jgi:hypothetical protein